MTGEELKDRIKDAGLTIKDVADALETSQQNLSAKLARKSVRLELVQQVMSVLSKHCTQYTTLNLNGDHSPNVMQNVSGDAAVWKTLYEEKCKELESLNKRFDQFVELIKKQE